MTRANKRVNNTTKATRKSKQKHQTPITTNLPISSPNTPAVSDVPTVLDTPHSVFGFLPNTPAGSDVPTVLDTPHSVFGFLPNTPAVSDVPTVLDTPHSVFGFLPNTPGSETSTVLDTPESRYNYTVDQDGIHMLCNGRDVIFEKTPNNTRRFTRKDYDTNLYDTDNPSYFLNVYSVSKKEGGKKKAIQTRRPKRKQRRTKRRNYN
jgi:hypothetical protein